MSLEFDLDGFFKSLNYADERVQAGAQRGMWDAVDDLVWRSRDLAPLDKRALRDSASGTVEVTNEGVIGEVTYSVTEKSPSGERFNYALYMHEFDGKPAYKNPTTPGTGPKFLERPLKQHSRRYLDMIADEIRKELT